MRRKHVLAMFVLCSLATLGLVQKGNVPFVEASSILSPSTHQGDLVLAGNSVTVIEGRFDINGSIIVEENATLILTSALLNFTLSRDYEFNMTFRNPAHGNPRLFVENTTIISNECDFNIMFYGNSLARLNGLSSSRHISVFLFSSFASVSNSTFGVIAAQQSSVLTVSNSSFTSAWSYSDSSVSISNCTFGIMESGGNSEISATNCTIYTFVWLRTWSANYSAIGIQPGFVRYWNFRLNCSVSVAPGGWVPNITLTSTQVEDWVVRLTGKSNSTISNSELRTLYIEDFSTVSMFNSTTGSMLCSDSSLSTLYSTKTQTLRSYEKSRVWLVNSTSDTYSINDQSKAYVNWYLDAHVIDSIGQNVSSANVTATYPNATAAESKLTDAQGWARLTLMDKMMNATGEYPVGNYTVEAIYQSYSNGTTVNMTENKEITLTLSGLVVTRQTLVFFNVNPNPTTVGQTITLKGILADEFSQPLPDETVKLYARPLAGSWTYITSLTTNGYGIFTWQATIPEHATGTFIFAVYYPDLETYESSYNFAILIIQ